jgi:hypothetical protein
MGLLGESITIEATMLTIFIVLALLLSPPSMYCIDNLITYLES